MRNSPFLIIPNRSRATRSWVRGSISMALAALGQRVHHLLEPRDLGPLLLLFALQLQQVRVPYSPP